ncbi:MAG: choice-of-anchor M domain-containing protein [Actinomycetaceae bacterium]|nr:choice-of-anchor M domain-containing protein [Actinomycetaceae bacterium]
MDIGVLELGGASQVVIGDDSALAYKCKVGCDPQNVRLVVNAFAHRNTATLEQGLEFLRSGGKDVYLLPQNQVRGLVWPGLSTEHLQKYAGAGVSLQITPESAPKGAKWWAFTDGAFRRGRPDSCG